MLVSLLPYLFITVTTVLVKIFYFSLVMYKNKVKLYSMLIMGRLGWVVLPYWVR